MFPVAGSQRPVARPRPSPSALPYPSRLPSCAACIYLIRLPGLKKICSHAMSAAPAQGWNGTKSPSSRCVVFGGCSGSSSGEPVTRRTHLSQQRRLQRYSKKDSRGLSNQVNSDVRPRKLHYKSFGEHIVSWTHDSEICCACKLVDQMPCTWQHSLLL